MKETGWVLDVYIDRAEAVVWLKSLDGRAMRLTDRYQPDLYAEPRKGVDPEALCERLLEHPNVLEVAVERKYTSVNDSEKSPVLRVRIDDPSNFRRALNDLERIEEIGRFFNTDLLPVQRYLFRRHFAPTSKVEVDFDEEKRLHHILVLDDEKEIFSPPFSVLVFELEIKSSTLTPIVTKDPIRKIAIRDENLALQDELDGDEDSILEQFEKTIRDRDPDVLVSPEIAGTDLPYIYRRCEILNRDLQLGRERSDTATSRKLVPYGIKGRVPLELDRYQSIGLSGVMERARFTLAPISMSAMWPAGKTIDSRQCYEALKKDILIPSSRMEFYKWISTAWEILVRDKGGLILSPKVGVHENVAELDFESEFPHIIMKHNLSYETVAPDGTDHSRPGFLADLTKKVIDRRLHFKHLRKEFPKDSREWACCEQRNTVLKEILVCIYGYSGCFANRFNNVTLYEEINRLGREYLRKTKQVVEDRGFEVVYADTDAIYVKKVGAARKDYEDLARLIKEQVGLPIALDHHYRFLVLLPQEADPDIEATRRYFGKLMDGELFYRGIELRRHDYPSFLKDFQLKLVETLLDCKTPEQVKTVGYKRALNHTLEVYDRVLDGDIDPQELVISKTLSKPVSQYRSMFPHVCAAIDAMQHGKRVRPGDTIDFVYVSSDHPNPLRRVMPAEMINHDHHYVDREKYAEMVMDVAETILGWNGFGRTQLGIRPRPRSFLDEIRAERAQDLLCELETLEDDRQANRL